jgi:hypothetical protein
MNNKVYEPRNAKRPTIWNVGSRIIDSILAWVSWNIQQDEDTKNYKLLSKIQISALVHINKPAEQENWNLNWKYLWESKHGLWIKNTCLVHPPFLQASTSEGFWKTMYKFVLDCFYTVFHFLLFLFGSSPQVADFYLVLRHKLLYLRITYWVTLSSKIRH